MGLARSVVPAVVVAVAAMTTGVSGALPARAAVAKPAAGPPPAAAHSGNQSPVPARGLVRPAALKAPVSARPLPAPVWPAAAHSVVTLTGGSPAAVAPAAGTAVVSVSPAGGGTPALSAVDVRVLDRARMGSAGGLPFAVQLTRTDAGHGTAPVRLRVDYSGFAGAYGGGYAGRLGLATLPACALTTPKVAACTVRTPVATANDPAARTLTATVQAGPAGSPGLVTVDSGTSSPAGDFRATDLPPAGAWSVAPGSGDFDYSVPITLPPSPAPDSTPSLSLNYDSQSVDGLTSAANGQSGPIGEGWSLSESYIERHFRDCSEDGRGATVGDLCWDSPNSADPAGADYTLILDGVASELIKDPAQPDPNTTVYRLIDDPGWMVQELYGRTVDGDNNGEWWVVTKPDGSRYYFGYGIRPSDGAHTNAVDNAAVFGNNTGEPCNNTSVECYEAYRWNLDLQISPNEVYTTYMYTKNTNNYWSVYDTPMERGYDYESHLSEIDYGYMSQLAGATYTDKVILGHSFRCTGAMDTAEPNPLVNGIPSCPNPSSATAGQYPDVPIDLFCGTADPNHCNGNPSPVFFTETMLTSIATYTVAPNGDMTQVTQYELSHSLHNPAGSVGPYLSLDYIQRKGTAGTGAAITLPTIAFSYSDMDNTLAGTGLDFGRLTGITTDTGARIAVTYGTPDACNPASPPAEAANTLDCYRHQYTPQGGTQTWAWYKKELVTQVQVDPGVGFGTGHDGDPVQTTTYTYAPGRAAWRFPHDPITPTGDLSWTDWRGYEQTTVSTGSGSDKNSTVYYLYQGMNGDRKIRNPGGSGDYKTATVTGTDAWSSTDYEYLADLPFEQVEEDAGGAGQEHVVHGYWAYDDAHYTGLNDGYIVRENQTVTRSKLSTSTSADSTWREHIVSLTFDPAQQVSNRFGLPVSAYDQGQTGVSTDDSCTTDAYAVNTAEFAGTSHIFQWFALPDDVRHYASACPGTGATQDSQVVTLYDGATSEATNVPTDGNPTGVVSSVSSSATISVAATYDGAGRVLTSTDGNGNTATTSYSPVASWPTSGVTVTTPAPDPSGVAGSSTGLATTTISSPYNGQPTSVVDANGDTTTVRYDTVGRLIKVWHPTEPLTGNASLTFGYTIPTGTSGTIPTVVNGPPEVTSQTLQALPSTYLVSYRYDDGLGRTRETQAPAVDGSAGRDVTSTRYDDAGDAVVTSSAFFSTGTAGSGMVDPALSALPSATQLTLDWAGRTTESQILALGVAQARGDVRTAYTGADVSTVTDPDGNTTDAYTDVFGRTSSMVQHTPALTPASITTTYAYTDKGRLATITDAAGHQSTDTYDWLGRRTAGTDPDTGTVSETYDADGNVTTTTDNKGQLVTTVYDALSRPVFKWNGAVGTSKLSSFTYDFATGGKGQLASSTSYNNGGLSYVTAVDGYDADGRPTGTKVTIPSGENGLAGSYDTTYGYDAAGHQTSVGYPAVGTATGALPAETVTTAYTATGVPSTVTSPLATYVSATSYANYGPLTGRTYGSGALTAQRTYTWSQATGDLTNITTTAAGTVQNDTYTLDSTGNVTEIADGVAGQQQCFGYDSLNRLVSAFTSTTASPTSCAGATPDHTGGPAPYDLAYQYDQLGDITSVVDNVTGTTGTYSYADPAHVHALTDVVRTGGATGHDTYAYNLNGDQNNRTVGGVPTSSVWTVQQQLSTTTSGGVTTTYYYDASGNRLIRKNASDTVLYLPGEELHLAGGTLTATRYYTEGGNTVAMRVGGTGNGTVSWTTPDNQQSAQLTISATDGSVTRQRYLPFGAQRGTQGPPTGTNRAFLNRPQDPNSGLVQDGARYYDPNTGRFIQPDPVVSPGNPQNLDAYGYSTNNPETLSDPSGLISCDADGDCAMGPLPGAGLQAGQPKPSKPAPTGGSGSGGSSGGSGCTSDTTCDHRNGWDNVTPSPVTQAVTAINQLSQKIIGKGASADEVARANAQMMQALLSLPSNFRTPDYIVYDYEWVTPYFVGGGVVYTDTRFGQDSFIGPQAGVGTPGQSLSIRAGWIGSPVGAPPSKAVVDSFVSGWSATLAVHVPICKRCTVAGTYGQFGHVRNAFGSEYGVTLGSPGIAVMVSYSIQTAPTGINAPGDTSGNVPLGVGMRGGPMFHP